MRVSRIISVVLAVFAWITFIGGLIYWHASVEPRLDGSEGAGVGFGWGLVHVWGAALALMFAGIAIGLRLCPNRIREFHKTEQAGSSNGGQRPSLNSGFPPRRG